MNKTPTGPVTKIGNVEAYVTIYADYECIITNYIKVTNEWTREQFELDIKATEGCYGDPPGLYKCHYVCWEYHDGKIDSFFMVFEKQN